MTNLEECLQNEDHSLTLGTKYFQCLWKEVSERVKEVEKKLTEDRVNWMKCYTCNGRNQTCESYNAYVKKEEYK